MRSFWYRLGLRPKTFRPAGDEAPRRTGETLVHRVPTYLFVFESGNIFPVFQKQLRPCMSFMSMLGHTCPFLFEKQYFFLIFGFESFLHLKLRFSRPAVKVALLI